MANMKRALFLLVAALALAASAFAQDSYDYKKEFGVTFGASPDSNRGIGVTEGQQFYEASINFGYVFWQHESFALKYKGSLVPFALVRGDEATLQLRPDRTVYGGGAEPIGLQLNFRNHHRVQPYLNLTGGFLYFTEQVPVTDSSQYNFTFSGGAGLEIFSGRHSFILGYRYHHISNGYTATYNPGIDSQIISLGFSFRR
jgi:opacity protein-like surface antigen